MPHHSAPSGLSADTEGAVERIVHGYVESNALPGLSWGIVAPAAVDHPLLAAGGCGATALAHGEPEPGRDRTPGPATLSRIASMSKSFAAAAILQLRDAGQVRLDDPVSRYVPGFSRTPRPTPDSPVVSLRHLLTMSAGLVTDNAWGDRAESTTPEQFRALLDDGLGWVHVPGAGYEYSNTAYAVLGQVISEVTDTDVTDYVRSHILAPLGMRRTDYDRAPLLAGTPDLDADLMMGHRTIDDDPARTRFAQIGFDSPGMFSVIGGLYSTVADLATWVRFLAVANTPLAPSADQAVLTTASRREMQQGHRMQHVAPLRDGSGYPKVRAYGYGLVAEEYPHLGEVVSHSGGYPGFGSYMLWHRPTGVGAIVLANSRYADAVAVGRDIMTVLREREPELYEAGHPAVQYGSHSALPLMERTRVAAGVLVDWVEAVAEDDVETVRTLASRWFAPNMELDTPLGERARLLRWHANATGVDLAAMTSAHYRIDSPVQVTWRLAGDNGQDLSIMLLLDPRKEGGIQAVEVSRVP